MAGGDEDSWREFHHSYFSRIYRYVIVLQRGDESAAADLVQQTLLRAVRHMRPFESEDVFWSWLTCLARCAAADEGRKQKRRLAFLEKFQHWQENRRDGNADAAQLQCERLTQCLAQLPENDRMLLEGKYFDRLTYCELAQNFELTTKAVESRLTRLRLKLRRAMDATIEEEDAR